MGRLLWSRDRFAGHRPRRAIVKTRLVRLRGRGFGAALAHLRYIQRDGVQRDGSPGVLYSAGAAIYALRRPNPVPAVFGYHEVFHALVIAGAVTHYAVMALFVLPRA